MLTTFCKSIFLPILFGVAIQATAQDRYTVTMQCPDCSHNANRQVYVYDCVDVPPHFPGGDGALVRFINNNRHYPGAAYEAGVEGRVVCSFVVGCNGSISNVDVVRSVEPSLDAEAKRVIENMPTWVAGRIDDVAVPVYCILAIPFRR